MADVDMVDASSTGQEAAATPEPQKPSFADFSARREAEDSGTPLPSDTASETKPSASGQKPKESEPVAEPGPQHGKKGSADERKAQLSAEIRELNRQKKELEADLEGKRGVKPPAEAPPAEKPKTEAAGRLKKPNLSDFGGASCTDEQYLEFQEADRAFNRQTARDDAREVAQEVLKAERAERERETGEVERRNKLADRHEAVKAEFSDYDEVLKANVAINDATVAFIERRENGLRVLYKLCQNPEEAERIFGLDPFEVVLELGKIEASLNGKPKTPARPSTRALKPGADLPGRNGAQIDRVAAAVAGRDTASYLRLREAEDAAR